MPDGGFGVLVLLANLQRVDVKLKMKGENTRPHYFYIYCVLRGCHDLFLETKEENIHKCSSPSSSVVSYLPQLADE